MGLATFGGRMTKLQRDHILRQIGKKAGLDTFNAPSMRWYRPNWEDVGMGPFLDWYIEGYYPHQLVKMAGYKWEPQPLTRDHDGDALLRHLAKLMEININPYDDTIHTDGT